VFCKVSGENLEIRYTGVRINDEEVIAINKTGIKALFFKDIFWKIS
jgi:hypothetical protein